MPDIKISELTLASSLSVNDVLPIVQTLNGNLTTMKANFTQVGNKVNKEIQYTSDLKTTSKTVLGAINETAGVWVSGTLTAGQTSLTLSNAAITTSSNIDIYTDKFGVNPTNAVVSTGQIVLTFPSQTSNLEVKVRVS